MIDTNTRLFIMQITTEIQIELDKIFFLTPTRDLQIGEITEDRVRYSFLEGDLKFIGTYNRHSKAVTSYQVLA